MPDKETRLVAEVLKTFHPEDADRRLQEWKEFKTWKTQREEEVLKALEALPASGEQEFELKVYASWLCNSISWSKAHEANSREWVTSDTRASIKVLQGTRQQLVDLADGLKGLPIKSRTALGYTLACEEEGEDAAKSRLPWNWARPPFSDFLEDWDEVLDEKRADLLALAEAMATAIKVLERDPSPAAQKPREDVASNTASKAAFIYREVTGTEATVPTRDGRAYGPFLSFLTGLFRALEIDASPESRARAARARRLKLLRKNPQGLDAGDRLNREILKNYAEDPGFGNL